MPDSYLGIPAGAFLEAMAAPSPAPAAGSAAALTLAQAAALCAKAARLSVRQLGADRVRIMLREIEQLREEATALIDADARAYERVIDAAHAVRAGRANDTQAGDELAAALSQAADVPMRIVELASELAGQAADLATAGNPNLIGDATAAALLSQAAATSAAWLVAINLENAPADPRPSLSDSLLSRIEMLSGDITRRP